MIMRQAAFVVMQMEWTASVITFKPSARKKTRGIRGGGEVCGGGSVVVVVGR